MAITSASPLTTTPIAVTLTGTSTDKPDGSTTTALTATTANGVVTTSFNSASSTSDVAAGQTIKAITAPVITSTDSHIPAATGVMEIQNFAPAVGLQYTSFGTWDLAASTSAPIAYYAGVFAGGDVGDITATMPTTGSASYAGGATGFALTGGNAYRFYGATALTANFATNAITGNITGINAYATGGSGPTSPLGTMNSIALSGTISGSLFSGTASASATAGTAVNITGATGTLNGGFFGPNAAETSGVFDLSGAGIAVMGSFGTTKVPSDRRLKVDIRPVAIRPDGLKFYSWRYRGGHGRFVGVMAQDLLADPRFSAAVTPGRDGWYRVDYARLGYMPPNLPRMSVEGEAAAARYRKAAH
uniref:transferrin-binding protein-like solute binding protein n=1 Tax=Sphingomonas bacterium TaxID=1895847 RepID=UPI00260B4C4B|nr:transferrin-binding protein-like solute binding protein [Sphingomonas bacterium]